MSRAAWCAHSLALFVKSLFIGSIATWIGLTRKLMRSRVRYEIASVYELPRLGLGRFDIVLFLGVLYHLRHPLLALEIVSELCTDIALIDSFVVDGDEAQHISSPLPWMEFYETDELGGQLDNWWGPSVDCLMAMIRSAGFVRPSMRSISHRHALVAAHRRWQMEPNPPASLPPELLLAFHFRNFGVNFQSCAEEYLSCRFACAENGLRKEDMIVEVGPYGAGVIFLQEDLPGRWFLNCQLPRGLEAGWHNVRLRTQKSRFSLPQRIAVDMSVVCTDIELVEVTARLTHGPAIEITGTVLGLSENADRNNVRIYANGMLAQPLLVAAAGHLPGGFNVSGSLILRETDACRHHVTITVGHGLRLSESKTVAIET